MPKSELEILLAQSDYNVRKYLLDLLDYKKQINKELQSENLPVERETSLKEALSMIEENIQKIRMDGIL